MASWSRIFQTKSTECNIVFEGLVQSSIRGKLTIEMIKYLAHQRGQIPLAYELVKRDFDRDLQCAADVKVPRGRLAGRNKLEVLKRKNAMNALDEIFRALEEVFSLVDPIPEVLILFGATVVSPKETYRLRFPTKCYDGKVLNWTTCRMALFQKLVSSDVFGGAKPLKPGTKITVLLQASRDSAATTIGLTTRPTFKVSHRGHHYIFNFVCKGLEINPEISHLDASLNISGIEPFDQESPGTATETHRIAVASPLPNATPVSYSKRKQAGKLFPGLQRKWSKLDSVEESPSKNDHEDRRERLFSSSDHEQNLEIIVSQSSALTLDDGNESDLMWFQIPVSMTGFRDKTSKAL